MQRPLLARWVGARKVSYELTREQYIERKDAGDLAIFPGQPPGAAGLRLRRCYRGSGQVSATLTFSPIMSAAKNIMPPAVMNTPVTPLIPKSNPPNAAPAAIED